MEQQSPSSGTNPGNGTAVLVSVLAAGAAVLAGAVLTSRPSKQERAQAQIEDQVSGLKSSADQVTAQLTRALEGLSFDREATTRKARKQANKLQKSSQKSVDEAVKAANKHIATFEKQAKGLKVREHAKGLTTTGSDQVSTYAASLGEQVALLLNEARQRATDAGSKASGSATEVRSKAGSKSRDLAHQASGELAGAKQDAGKLAQDVKARGADLVTTGTALVSDALKKSPDVKEKLVKVADDTKQHAPEVKESLAGIADSLVARGSDLAARAREQAPDLAATAKESAQNWSIPWPKRWQRSPAISGRRQSHWCRRQRRSGQRRRSPVASAKDTGGSLVPELQAQAGAIGGKVSTGTHAIGEQSKAGSKRRRPGGT